MNAVLWPSATYSIKVSGNIIILILTCKRCLQCKSSVAITYRSVIYSVFACKNNYRFL